MPYCHSRFQTLRRTSRVVQVGKVPVGGNHPIVVQSMTTTPTQDVKATVDQCIALAEAGCQVVRITAQNVKAAEALGLIRKAFSSAGFAEVPLVADIHFLPQAAMEAAKHVEKVRINPGNYADKKKFAVQEYSDDEYQRELERLHEAFSPIVLRCRDLGRAMRIGTNHGSLSDRIMNRYGDTPEGMVESALEFIRICESHNYRSIIVSMKASNPKVMIQAYRLMAARMDAEGMPYPLHLGVTEAGDGDDARIKSAVGIGGLLYDGLGDTIRVSLTEDPVAEIPVALALARKAESLWAQEVVRTEPDPINPYQFEKRKVDTLLLGKRCIIAPLDPPRVITCMPKQALSNPAFETNQIAQWQDRLRDARIEGLLMPPLESFSAEQVSKILEVARNETDFILWETESVADISEIVQPGDFIVRKFHDEESLQTWQQFFQECKHRELNPCLDILPELLASASKVDFTPKTIFSCTTRTTSSHALGTYRQLAEVLAALGSRHPIWIRNTTSLEIAPEHQGFGDRLLESSCLSGPLLCDGLGDLISIETVEDPVLATNLAYNLLQGTRSRSTKTEYVACPSCGRTLFDLQSTTQRIRAATGHLKGVTIAVMGCIVNGPGEMADADFGYVGGSPGKVNLYVGKKCVRYHIPANEAVDALIDLIREHGKWADPTHVETSPS
ncbi:MAG: (E)-4-hydroxy-3-methylbut-2-enyl-diphosphate synthase [Opitutales bacterium]|nr:(E)-4-hydroxy-3-methylbut-2-enyl-diphosphate synthase [Opitutales bacterium]